MLALNTAFNWKASFHLTESSEMRRILLHEGTHVSSMYSFLFKFVAAIPKLRTIGSRSDINIIVIIIIIIIIIIIGLKVYYWLV